MIQLVSPADCEDLWQYHPCRVLPTRHYYLLMLGNDAVQAWDPYYYRPDFVELVAAVIRPGSPIRHSQVMWRAIGFLRSLRKFRVAFTYCMFGDGMTYRGCTWEYAGRVMHNTDGTFDRRDDGIPLYWKGLKPQFRFFDG